jgi:hypothetical protein
LPPAKERVNLTQVKDDDEPTLLMAMVEESHDAVEPALEQQQLVHLDETKAQAFLCTSCSDDNHLESWYLDTGATNHMMGRGNVFFELDRAVQGTIKFGDGSVINICGKRTIIFFGRHDEHKALTSVYWIPRLKNSIISVGQMDEGGARVLKAECCGFGIGSIASPGCRGPRIACTGWSYRWSGHSVSRCIRTTTLGAGTNDSTTQILGHLKRWAGWRWCAGCH